MDLGYWVQMYKAVDPPMPILFFLAQDLGQLNCWLKAYFLNGYVKYNMNWDFCSLIVWVFWACMDWKPVQSTHPVCIFIFYEAGKCKSYKALIHHLVHGLCADINMWRPNSYMGMGVIPTHNSHGTIHQFSQPLCLCWGCRQLLWRNFYAILPLIGTSQDNDQNECEQFWRCQPPQCTAPSPLPSPCSQRGWDTWGRRPTPEGPLAPPATTILALDFNL